MSDPTVGLANLKSYHTFLQQDVTGTLKGAAFERHTQIELTRAPADGDYDVQLTLQGSDEPTTYLRILALGKASYLWTSKDKPCRGAMDDQTASEMIDPTSLLLAVSAATKAGTETVNGIGATHYRFNQTGLPLADPKPSASGEVWIANQGGYIVKYSLNLPAPAKADLNGMRAGQTLEYELRNTDGTAKVELPPDCVEVLTDIPVMPDAQSVLQANGMTDFVTASSARQVLDFYAQRLPALGWQSNRPLPTGDVKLPFSAPFTNGGRRISLHLSEAKPSGVEVTFLLLAGAAGTAAPSAVTPTSGGATATARPAPTVPASESGLPVDIPLYPGATGLSKLNEGIIEFATTDSPDKVDQFYQQQMPANQWSLMSTTKQGANIIDVWIKGNRVASVSIMPQGDKTLVMITFTTS